MSDCACGCGAPASEGKTWIKGHVFRVRSWTVTHRQANTPAHRSWSGMKSRCNNKNATGYQDYGGRGIRVCDRWNLFENFLADMGERPPGTSLDRIDGSGNYEPGNCRWATRLEQSRNRRTPKKTRLTDDDVAHIFLLAAQGWATKFVAQAFGICDSSAHNIISGRTRRGALARAGLLPAGVSP